MNVIIMVCTKKFCSGQMGHFGPKNGTYSELWIGSKNFLKILLNERANRYLKILLVVF